jgi:uncharacterized protein YndB with AHSA1/START domain
MSSGRGTVILENSVDVARPPEVVFDYVTDISNEFEWNPKTKRVEKLTDGPIGLRTRYEGEWIKGDPMLVEYVGFDRPTTWRSEGRSKRLTAVSESHVMKTAEGTHLVIGTELAPKGALRLVAPLLRSVMRRREDRNLLAIKARLEGNAPSSDGSPVPPRVARRRIGFAILDALSGVPLFATAPLYRHWHMRWGATDEEVQAPMPGDDLVPKVQFNATRAITIDAPLDMVWPWIVQMGYRRAGFYTYALLDNAGYESADDVIDEFQHPQIGDWMPMAKKVNDTTAFRLKAFEKNQWLLWAKPDSTWAWKLVPLEGGRTRVVSRLKALYVWRRPLSAILSLILLEFGDFPMIRRVLKGIKARAERLAEGGAEDVN